MLKVRAVTDKTGTAIDRLAKGLIPYMQNIDYEVIDVHPKRPSLDQLKTFEIETKDVDLIDYQYFRTAEMLREKYSWLKDKPSMLTHYNPYSITESDWNEYDLVIGCNKNIAEKLGENTVNTEYVPLTIDTEFWTYNPDWSPSNKVLMVANRIESKKGILEVALACKKIGARFVLVGSISDGEYYHEVIRTGGVEFHQKISDEELRKLYHNCTIHVCNSVDNFESGTLPMLEAMLCGTPVLTRRVGHVPDLNNGENMVIHDGAKDDVDAIASKLKEMLDESEKLKQMRDKAWQTAKTRSNERRAFIYQKLYRQVLYPEQQSVTVIMPVFERPEITQESIKAIENQTYKNIELIVINDAEPENIEANTPLFRFIQNGQGDYGLARARNKAIIEATGDILVFCDQRMVMEPNAIEEFVKHLQRSKWIYGQKNGIRKEFVENFSCVYRDEIIRRGMFCERIDEYGGMSQYTRSIAKLNGMTLEYIESAKAQQIGKSSNRNRKRDEIIRIKTKLWKMNFEG